MVSLAVSTFVVFFGSHYVCHILRIFRILVVVYISPGGAQTSDICSILRDLGYKVQHLFFWNPILIFLGISWVLKDIIYVFVSVVSLGFLFVFFRFP